MSLTLGGSNSGAMRSLSYMSSTKAKMDKSLQRISSGKRILNGSDDPGGLSVAMKLQSQLNSLTGASDRIENAKSFVEMQGSALKTAGDILIEMDSLITDYKAESDPRSDTAITYATQFRDLQVQLGNLRTEKFNGVSLFSSHETTSMEVSTSTSGASGASVTLDNLDFLAALDIATNINLGDSTSAGSVSPDQLVSAEEGSAVSISHVITEIDDNSFDFSSVISEVANLRAQTGGKLSALEFAGETADNMSVALEAAHGRIMDVDLAEESANYASLTLQYEAAAAAVAQANTSAARVFDLLIGSINRD